MYDLPNAPEVLSSWGNLCAGVGTLVGAFVAYHAVDSWRRERSSDLAKSIAAKAYELRERLHQVRVDFVIDIDHKLNPGVYHAQGVTREVLLLRRESIFILLHDLRGLCAEANLRWKDAAVAPYKFIEAKTDDIGKLVREYNTEKMRFTQDQRAYERALNLYEQDGDSAKKASELARTNELHKAASKQLEKLEKVTDELFGSSDDAMGQSIDASFVPMTEFLRKHI